MFPTWWKGIGKGDVTSGGGSIMGLIWFLTILTSVFQVVALAVILNVVENGYRRYDYCHWCSNRIVALERQRANFFYSLQPRRIGNVLPI
ncbi:MAG: hypothetical protein CVU43_20875 [Chloroflexi bacterium HGW-Chloroflexi-5]|nr:MAG: hypothetical protein CVU43_20875 [Chloroflexi bacterium HGW-Chloroflexi-5]